MFRKLSPPLLIITMLLLSFSSTISAQGGPLSYDSLVTDTLNPGTPIIYTFSGTSNDMVTIYVVGSAELQPTLAISDSSGQPLGFSSDDALTPTIRDVRVTALLPADDTYIVTLNNAAATGGTFTLSLFASQSERTILAAGSTTISIVADGTAQEYLIPGNPDGSQTLSIESLVPGTGYTARLHSADGKILAAIAGGLGRSSFDLPANELGYILVVDAEDSAIGAEVEVVLAGGTGAPPPATTEEAQAQRVDPNVCTVTASGVNVRSGPGTNFDIVGSLNDGGQFIATGQNSGWYYGNFNGQTAWVASSVVNAVGNCANLSLVDAPAAPVPAATEEPQNQQQQPTTAPPTATTQNQQQQQPTTAPPTATTAPTTVPFNVVSLSCRYFLNDGATVDFHVTGEPSGTFRIDVRQGNTTYSADRTMNQQGFLNANQRFGQVGNNNYTAYIVYNGADVANTDC